MCCFIMGMCHTFWKTMFLWFYLQIIGFVNICQEQIWDRHITKEYPPNKDMKRYVLVTGATKGIGLELVKDLLRLQYRVVIGCRDPARMDQALAAGVNDGNVPIEYRAKVNIYKLDLNSMSSVENFARHVINLDVPLMALVNNAGIMFGPKSITTEGHFESQLCTNYLGHFKLTSFLMPLLTRAGDEAEEGKPARIVNVTSCAHFLGSWMDINDLNCEEFYSGTGAYGNSKAMQIMFTKHLDAKLQTEGVPIRVHSIHPGIVNTGLYDDHASCTRFFGSCLMKSAKQGAEAVLYAVLSPDLNTVGGTYIENTHQKVSSSFTRDEAKQGELFTKTLKMLGMGEFGEREFGRQRY